MVTPCQKMRKNSVRSFRPDAHLEDEFLPAWRLPLDERTQLLRRAADQFGADSREPVTRFGLVDGRDDFAMEFCDDRQRRGARRADRVPGAHFKPGPARFAGG